MLLRPALVSESVAPDEVLRYRDLAASVLARAAEDLGDQDLCLPARSWLLGEGPHSLWGGSESKGRESTD